MIVKSFIKPYILRAMNSRGTRISGHGRHMQVSMCTVNIVFGYIYIPMTKRVAA